MLNLEITDNFKKRRHLISKVYFVTRTIENNLPTYLCQKFFSTQYIKLQKLSLQENKRFLRKLSSIQPYNPTMDNNIKNIKYFYSTHVRNSHNNLKFSFNKYSLPSNDIVYDIELDPSDYNTPTKSLLEPREKWFINKCNTCIPNEVVSLLQLGEGFCLPPTDNFDAVIQYVKHVENNFFLLQKNNNSINKFRNQIFPFINSLNKVDRHRSEIDYNILSLIPPTKRFIKDNPDILFTRADKGNTVVALDRMDYIVKMENYLSDTNIYSILQRNPVNKLLKNLKQLLNRWSNSKYITTHTHNFLNSSNPILPRAYGLPKIHKQGLPLRIIVSSSGSPLHSRLPSKNLTQQHTYV